MLFILYLLALSLAAYVPTDNFSTLTPEAKPTGTTDFDRNFGIQIQTIHKKREIHQIDDGQIQNTTDAPTPTKVINQIGDGQIQNQPTASVIHQIDDGQIQNQQNVNQIGDGQIQNQQNVNQIGDGQIQNTNGGTAKLKTCAAADSLTMTLKKSILTDSHGRIGAIVANRQFQFDGPPPQAGSIYAAGWSINDGHLQLGDKGEFYQCLSGDFYNLYDENVAEQCVPVYLEVVEFDEC